MKEKFGSFPLGGRVRHFAAYWKSFTRDSFVLRNIKGLELEFLEPIKQVKEPHMIRMNDAEKIIMDKKVQELLENETIKIVNHKKGEGFISNVFLREKRDLSHRMILNLKILNLKLRAPHFKMNTISDVVKMVRKGMMMA